MEHTFTNFLSALRGAEIRVSVAETLDAMKTAALMGWSDRQGLHDALAMALAKTPDEKAGFTRIFDEFFAFESFHDRREARILDESRQSEDGDLLAMLRADDRAGLVLAMQEAAIEVGVENIRFFTQRGLYTQRVLQQMGVEGVDSQIQAMGGQGGSAGQALRESRAWLFEQVRNYVEHQLSLQGAATSRELREDRLRRSRLGNLDRRDREQMRRIVEKICRRLVTLHSRRRKMKNRGQLDIRRTMRRNYGHDGVLFELEWKKRKLDRPRVMAICDVSGSVASVARFLLQFLYELHELLRDIRSFAFSGHLIEVSEYFKENIADMAAEKVMQKVGYMPTDYGESFTNFYENFLADIDRNTTIIILGDARSNNTNPKAGYLKQMHERCKRLIWLNPEPPPLWGTGDSEMRRYRPYCDLLHECNTLNHLERVVNDLLETAQKAA
ncbi:MAG: VWA domain-containing protein [Alphaproteobacteria bacterium]|nr:VWA domain-containing protein [Alphaproteobacteria bacterium]